MKLLFVLLLIAPASQAFAGSPPTSGNVRQAVVRYNDLNLRNVVGAVVLGAESTRRSLR